MAEDLVSCPTCDLRHPRRPDATCPRCRGPVTLAPGPATAITEARARVAWGYAPEEVERFLIEKGMSKEQAASELAVLMTKRDARFRKRGRTDVVRGSLSLAAGAGLMVLSYQLDVHVAWMEDLVEVPFLAGVGLAAFGVFRLARGLPRVMLGGQGEGSETELD